MFLVVVFICFAALDPVYSERFIFISSSVPPLEKYNVDKTQISVSGISSGAAMATQMHVIYSSHFMGVGMIAGLPFACAEVGGAVTAETICMHDPSLVLPAVLELTTDEAAEALEIDPTSYMRNDKVYIFNGKADTMVDPAIGPVIKEYYHHYVAQPRQHIKTVFNIDAEHGQPTDNYGAPCNQLNWKDFINNCNYSVAYDLLNFIYGGNLTKPTPDAKQTGQLKTFDQTEFFTPAPSDYSIDDEGYIYVPQTCSSRTRRCKLHIAFHGCEMGRKYIGDDYLRHGGYNEVADLNDIIILYPQAIKTEVPLNPNGCWDWWGYTGITYATNGGFQPVGVMSMIDRITG